LIIKTEINSLLASRTLHAPHPSKIWTTSVHDLFYLFSDT